jgi:lipoprotein-anchoring transpeptidase ErfK/SrfK
MRRALSIATLLLATLAVTPASAQSGRYVTPPPIVLSPDLTEPWVMQLKPGRKTLYAKPPATRATIRTRKPQVAEPEAQANAATPPARTYTTDPKFLPTVVDYTGGHAPGTVIIDTNERFLYLVEDSGTARRYGVGVGRPGFEWAGSHRVTRKAEWPDWHPPAEMRRRQPHLPVMMAGGPKNPLGARALYLGSTLYRIHGTSEPWTIGSAVSSGCIRMRNEDVIDLYDRVPVGSKVVVM